MNTVVRLFWAMFGAGAAAAGAGEAMDFDRLKARVAALAAEPRVVAADVLPPALEALDYVGYREIEFRVDRAWWSDAGLPFRLSAYHRGGLFRDRVLLSEVAPGGEARALPFSTDRFNYRALGELPGLDNGLGFAGYRILHELNAPGRWDEVASFLGASYFRVVPRGGHYGLSARGLAIDSGLADRTEEFPCWRAFWVRRPEPGDAALRIWGLLESRRVVGAVEINLRPGRETVMVVRVALQFREAVAEAGWAPLTSMFWYGEEGGRPEGEVRPEVHDSDGLWLQAEGDAAPVWQPLRAVSRATVTEWRVPGLRGFGLLQRDREPDHYRDGEAHYHLRPSAWIEPAGDWGPGVVRLVELPAFKEYADNIVAYWRPDQVVAPGEWVEYSYRLVWSETGPKGM